MRMTFWANFERVALFCVFCGRVRTSARAKIFGALVADRVSEVRCLHSRSLRAASTARPLQRTFPPSPPHTPCSFPRIFSCRASVDCRNVQILRLNHLRSFPCRPSRSYCCSVVVAAAAAAAIVKGGLKDSRERGHSRTSVRITDPSAAA